MNTDTPETDAHRLQFAMGGLTLDFCRKLERERDEAREQLQFNHKATLVIERMLYEAREQRDRLAAALRECREDCYELLAERDWWQNETRLGYNQRYQQTRDNIDRATAALQSLTLNSQDQVRS